MTVVHAAPLLLLLAACDLDVPLAGKPCPNGDADCASPSDGDPFFCKNDDEAPVCLPGEPLAPRTNLLPLLQPIVIVTTAGAVVDGRLTAIDPDQRPGDPALRYRLLGASPSNGTLEVAANGAFRFVADPSGAVRRSIFQVEVVDGEGGRSAATMTSVVISVGDQELLTWTGAESTGFVRAENWSPEFPPTEERTVFVPLTELFSPRALSTASVASVYIGPNVPYDLRSLVVTGDELYSASSVGTGTFVIRDASTVAGVVPDLMIEGRLRVDSTLQVQRNITFDAQSEATLEAGALLAVNGDLVQLESAGGVAVVESARERGVDVSIDGALILRGAEFDLGAGRLFLAGDLESSGAGIVAQHLILQGKELQRLSSTSRVPLPSTTSTVSSNVRFTNPATIAGVFDVAGNLSVRPGVRLVVQGRLTLQSTFAPGDEAGGEVVAQSCDISPGVSVPPWILCGVSLDAGPLEEDSGVFDAGFDGGVPDAGVDGGAIDAGVDAGVPDGGAMDAGVDGGAIDAGVDAGVPDGGAMDAGVDGGALDAGQPDAGQPDAGSDAGVIHACSGRVFGGVVVVEAGQTRTTSLRVVDEGGAASFGVFDPQTLVPFADSATVTLDESGALTVATSASTPAGYTVVPHSLTIDDAPITDCATIRVVGLDEGIRPVPSGNWNWGSGWGDAGVPDVDDVVFIPAGLLDGETIEVEDTIESLLIETEADIALRWAAESPPVKGELALGESVEIQTGRTLQIRESVRLASAAELVNVDCAASAGVKLMGHLAVSNFGPSDCEIDLNGWTAVVDGPVTLTYSAENGLKMDHPTSRLVAEEIEIEVGQAGPPMTQGEILSRGDVIIRSLAGEFQLATAEHVVFTLPGTPPATVNVQASIGTLILDKDTRVVLNNGATLERLELGDVDFCLSVVIGTTLIDEVIAAGGADYVSGPSVLTTSCEGSLPFCASLLTGVLLGGCPF